MTAAALKVANIPDELKQWKRWTVWKLEQAAGRPKPSKVPYCADGGGKASTTNDATWATFDQALAAMTAGSYDGLGVVFTGTPFTGIDLYAVINADGDVAPQVPAAPHPLHS